MSKFAYPAIFTQEDDVVYVNFPDLPDVQTFGTDLPDAIEMAEDVLNLAIMTMEDAQESFSKPSNPNSISHLNNQIVSMVSCDTDRYRELYGTKSIKKTLTIPLWLNTKAEQAGINFSSVLQNALKTKLGIL